MKVTFHPTGAPTRACRVPFPGADHVVVEGACPACGAVPFHAAGIKGTVARGHDTYTANAGCLVCGIPSGQLVARVDTIFGIEEDERVLMGRCRVY